MAQTVIQNLLHIVITTREQKDLIPKEHEKAILNHISQIFGRHQTHVLAIGAHLNHIHIVCNLSKVIALAYLIREAKSGSERWIIKEFQDLKDFKWQDGYAAFSLNPTEVDPLIEIVNNQHEYHKGYSFEEEYHTLLEKYNVKFNRLHLW